MSLSSPLPSRVETGRFVPPVEIRRAVLSALRPPKKMSVSECAERYRHLTNPGGGYSGPWRNAKAPYLVEIMDATTSRSVDIVAVGGPAQFGKTEIFLNGVSHAAMIAAGDILHIQPTRDAALDFAYRRLGLRTINNSKDIRDQVGPNKSDDNRFTKRFKNGTILNIGWAVGGHFASKPLPRVQIDERDLMPDDIGGEGDPVSLGQARNKTFKSNGIVVVASTFRRTNGTGIYALIVGGTFEVWFWPCAECGEPWSPGFDEDRKPTMAHLYIPEGATPEIARLEAHLVCPHCGSLLEERQKEEMNARGCWVPRGMTVDRHGVLHGERPKNRTRSFWLHGFVTPFTPWRLIAEHWVAAIRYYNRTQDESKLKTVTNLDLGIPYRPKHGGGLPIDADDLQARQGGYRMGTVPEWVRYLTAAVDIQGNRFAVGVKGWGADGESCWIDRFDIAQLDDEGREKIDPAQVGRHWDLLINRVLLRAYPLASNPELELPVAATSIDTGGSAGVTERAKDFFKRAVKGGVADWQIMLIKGHNTKTAPPLPQSPTFENDDDGKRLPESAPVYLIGVNTLKDTVDTRLRLTKPGPGYQHFPEDAPGYLFEELAGEVKTNDKWDRVGPNESFDIDVYCEAARLRLRVDRVNWNNPPPWARPRKRTAAKVIEMSAPNPVKRARRSRRTVRGRVNR